MKYARQFHCYLFICFGVTLVLTTLTPSQANACSPVFAQSYDQGAATDAAPPPVTITDIDLDLGEHFGGGGSGDCSDLGHVTIFLETPDGVLLDEDFGARINLLSGELNPLLDDDGTISDFVFPIENNAVHFVITGDNDSVDIAVTAQTVNGLGELGPESAPASAEAEAGCGCNTVGTTPSPDTGIWAVLLIVLGLSFD